jgi:hypothetical protein
VKKQTKSSIGVKPRLWAQRNSNTCRYINRLWIIWRKLEAPLDYLVSCKPRKASCGRLWIIYRDNKKPVCFTLFCVTSYVGRPLCHSVSTSHIQSDSMLNARSKEWKLLPSGCQEPVEEERGFSPRTQQMFLVLLWRGILKGGTAINLLQRCSDKFAAKSQLRWYKTLCSWVCSWVKAVYQDFALLLGGSSYKILANQNPALQPRTTQIGNKKGLEKARLRRSDQSYTQIVNHISALIVKDSAVSYCK